MSNTPSTKQACCPKCSTKGVAHDSPNMTYFGEEYCGNINCKCHQKKGVDIKVCPIHDKTHYCDYKTDGANCECKCTCGHNPSQEEKSVSEQALGIARAKDQTVHRDKDSEKTLLYYITLEQLSEILLKEPHLELNKAIEECVAIRGNKALDGSYAAPREAFRKVLRGFVERERAEWEKRTKGEKLRKLAIIIGIIFIILAIHNTSRFIANSFFGEKLQPRQTMSFEEYARQKAEAAQEKERKYQETFSKVEAVCGKGNVYEGSNWEGPAIFGCKDYLKVDLDSLPTPSIEKK